MGSLSALVIWFPRYVRVLPDSHANRGNEKQRRLPDVGLPDRTVDGTM